MGSGAVVFLPVHSTRVIDFVFYRDSYDIVHVDVHTTVSSSPRSASGVGHFLLMSHVQLYKIYQIRLYHARRRLSDAIRQVQAADVRCKVVSRTVTEIDTVDTSS